MRNRRYVQRKGPLVIYGNDAGIRCGAAPRSGPRASFLPLGCWQQLPCGCRAALGTRGFSVSGIWRVHAAETCPPGALAAWLCCQMRQVAPSPSCPAPRCRPAAAARPARPPRSRAFRNLPGVELCSVDRLNLLQLAPGGHLGRFCVWTKSAVEKLDSIFGGCCRRCCRHLARPQAGGPRCMPSAACPALFAACSWLRPTAQRRAVPPAKRTRAAARPATTLHPASSAADARLETPRPAGTTETESAQKKGYKLPRHIMANGDLARLINSDEVQSVVKPHKSSSERAPLKKNPLRNLGAMLKLNPYAKVRCRHASRRPRPASPPARRRAPHRQRGRATLQPASFPALPNLGSRRSVPRRASWYCTRMPAVPLAKPRSIRSGLRRHAPVALGCQESRRRASAPPRLPFTSQAARRAELLAAGKANKEEKLAATRKAKAAARPAIKKVSKTFYNTMITDSGERPPGPEPALPCCLTAGTAPRAIDCGAPAPPPPPPCLPAGPAWAKGAARALWGARSLRPSHRSPSLYAPACTQPHPLQPPHSPTPPPNHPTPADYVGEDYEVFSTWLGTTQ